MIPGGGWQYGSLEITYGDTENNELAPVKYGGIGTTTVWTNENKS